MEHGDADGYTQRNIGIRFPWITSAARSKFPGTVSEVIQRLCNFPSPDRSRCLGLLAVECERNIENEWREKVPPTLFPVPRPLIQKQQ